MSQVKQVKDETDIVDVIGQRLDLKRSGSSFKALCPFHSEKSPSFFVNPQLQRYRCFGCGARGDVLEFLQQYEGMSFYEALQFLADQAGIELKQYSRTQDDDKREKIREILSLASQYFHYLLTEHKSGQPARDYLKQRGVQKSSIELFKLGYSLPAWDGLFNYLTRKKKFDPELIEQSGLLIKNRTGRYYDRFRGRLVFPLKNHRGQIVGYSGRLIETDDTKADNQTKQPKYINTPETTLYHKSKTLYGYSELFQQIRKKKEVIVCEGEFDVISSHQAHVSHIAAIKGSALTPEQAKLLERTVEKVIITLDSDEAGVKATRRAIQVVNQTNLDLRVIDLSSISAEREIQDVDDLVSYDSGLWREISKKSVSAYEFLIDTSFRNYEADTAVGRRNIIDELAQVIKNIPHEVEKDFYIKQLSSRLNVSVPTLIKDIDKFGQPKSTLKKRSKKSNQESDKQQKKPIEQLQEYLLYLLFNAPDEVVMSEAAKLRKLGVSDPQAKHLLDSLADFQEDYTLSAFAETLPEDIKALLMEWCHHPDYSLDLNDLVWKKEWDKSLKKYELDLINNQIKKHNDQLAEIDAKEDGDEEEKAASLLQKIAKLHKKRSTLLSS